ncbi:MAG: molybdopterin oxidoreductase, partial [Bacteroidota bacterium]
ITGKVLAQAEVKSILKSSGERFKVLRAEGTPLYTTPTNGVIIETEVEEVEEAEPVSGGLIGAPVMQLLGAIGNFDKDTQIPDDLKKVKGIGPLMEKTLNRIGIFSFLQVSKMTENEYNLLDSITGSFPGRAQRDDWAGQARTLINLDK